MLDRKTKDINASIEILEDREKFYNLFYVISLFTIVCWGILLIFLTYVVKYIVDMDVTEYTTLELIQGMAVLNILSMVVCAVAVSLIVLSIGIMIAGDMSKNKYSLLIYLKRLEKKRKK